MNRGYGWLLLESVPARTGRWCRPPHRSGAGNERAALGRTYPSAVAMLPTMLEQDRRQWGWSVEQAAWRLGVTVREYRALEAGERSPNFETWDRICKLYG